MNYSVTTAPVAANKKASDQKHCFSCGVLIHISAQNCPNCGAMQPSLGAMLYEPPPSHTETKPSELPLHHVFCRGCGKPIHSQALTCPKCGAPQRATSSNLPFSSGGKDRIGAALLAFFLGGFGGHKFYLGQVGMGILYLIFCWTFIPAIVALIEGVIYLSQSDAEFRQKYG